MFATARFGFFAGALAIGTLAQGCSAPTASSVPSVRARAQLAGAPTSTASKTSATKSAAIRPMDDSDASGVQIVELNGYYQGCTDRAGSWSVAVNGADVQLDNPPLTVVQSDTNCQLIATEVRGDQLYEATAPLQLSTWSSSPFTAQDSDGGSAQTAFYLAAVNMDATYSADFALELLYSPGPSDTASSMSATYSTTSASVESDQIPSPDYSVDLSQVAIQTDANQMVVSVSGSAGFNFNFQSGTGYVIDDGTLPANPTFGQVDAAYTSQSYTSFDWNGFSIDATALSLQGSQLPVVRNVIIAGGWLNSVTSYQVISMTFNAATDDAPNAKRIQIVRK